MKAIFRNFRWGEDLDPQQMATVDGIVIDRGPLVNASKDFQVQDLGGRILQPKFIDNHCHILPTGLDLAKLNLSYTRSHEQVLNDLAEFHSARSEGWLLAVHYDQNRYDGIHLNLSQLDSISSTRPILLRHSSGHAGIANSTALELAGIDSSVVNDQGSTFERDASGRLTGVLLENAFERVSRAIPRPSFEEMVNAILRAGEGISDLDICCASDMQTGSFDLIQELEAYREATARGCKIAMRLYLQWGRVFGPRCVNPSVLRELVESFDGIQCRVQGIKLFADGAIGAGTAAIYGSYADQPTTSETSGALMYKPELLKERILKAAGEGWQVSVHAIGDYAADLVMDAFEDAERTSTHRLEHAMLLTDAQIERLQRLDCHICLQPEFLGRFGETYQRKLGPERSSTLIRFRSLIDAGLKVSFSSDRPITAGDPRRGIQLASDRPEGFSSAENCSTSQAAEAYTTFAARATTDEHLFGSLEKGQRAEFFLAKA